MVDGGSNRFRSVSSALVALLLLMSMTALGSEDAEASHLSDAVLTASPPKAMAAITPIRVDNDAELAALIAAEGWPGSGSAADPYVIEGLRYIAPNVDEVVRVANTTSHLILRNLTIMMAPTYGIVLSSASNVTLDTCAITNGSNSLNIDNCHDLAITNCTIAENWYGIQLTSCRDSLIDNNSLESNYMEAISLHSCHHITISENMVTNYTDGISLYSSADNLVKGNFVSDLFPGIKLYESNDNTVQENTLLRASLYMYRSNGNGLLLNEFQGGGLYSGLTYIELMSSSGNDLRENTLEGCNVFLEGRSDSNLFQGNRISNATYGIRIQSSTQNVLWGNEFRDACVILGKTDDFKHTSQTISANNTVDGRPIYYYNNANMNNATVPLDAGEVLVDNVTYLTIQNLALGNVAAGIEVHYSDHLTIRANTVSNTGYGHGIYMFRVNQSQVWDNELISSDLFISGSNNNTLRGNHVQNSNGMSLHASIYNQIQDNELVNASITLSSGFLFSDPLEDLMFSQNEITTNNTVNGGPIYFFKYTDMGGGSVPSDAGQIILAYVENARVHDLDLGHQFHPLFLYHCSYFLIENNTFEDISGSAASMDGCGNGRFQYNTLRNCSGGIYLEGSYNVISHNTALMDRPLPYEGEALSVRGSYNQISYNEFSGGKYGNTGVIGSGNHIEHNSIEGAGIGLGIGGDLNLGSDQNVISENRIANCSMDGILIDKSDGNMLIGNQVVDCMAGICIRGTDEPDETSSDNKIYGNTMIGCSLTFSYTKVTLTTQTITPNNTVNGKPIYYYKSVDMGGSSVPLDAGQVILAEVQHLDVRGLDLSHQANGLLVMWSSFISVRDCTFANDSLAGAQFYLSHDCELESNQVSDCMMGLDIIASDSNTLAENTVLDCETGIRVSGQGNLLERNRIERGGGVMLGGATSSAFRNNTINDSSGSGLYLYFSSENTISDNVICGSQSFGMRLEYSVENRIERNMMIDNNGCGSTYDAKHAQAFDDRLSEWNSTLGNYWSDWTDPDVDRDGIVDSPYAIAANGIAFDMLPLASPVGVPHGLQATVDDGTVKLTWVGVNYSLVGPIESLTLYRSSLDGTISFALGPEEKAFDDSTVAASYAYTYWLVARASGYQSGPSGEARVTVPGQHLGPTIDITSPEDQSLINHSSLQVDWTGTDPGGNIAYYWLRLDSSPWQNASTSTSWTLDGLGEGAHSIVVKGFNQTGGNGSDGVIFTVDTVSPTVQIATIAPFINTSTVIVAWTGSDIGSGVQGYQYRVDSGAWSSPSMSTQATIDDLPDALHRVDVRVMDTAGNSAEAAVLFQVDTLAPTVTIDSPEEGRILNVTSVQVEWSSDGTGSILMNAWTSLDGAAWETWPGTTENAGFIGLSEGQHEVRVRVMEPSGTMALDSVRFVVDTVAPTVTSHSPTGDSVPAGSIVSVGFSEAMEQESVDIDVSGMSGTVSWNGDVLTFTPTSAMPQGTHHWVNVTGSDLAGNDVAYGWEFDVAESAPTQDYSWLWLLILLIIVIAVVIYYLDRRRRKKGQKKAP